MDIMGAGCKCRLHHVFWDLFAVFVGSFVIVV